MPGMGMEVMSEIARRESHGRARCTPWFGSFKAQVVRMTLQASSMTSRPAGLADRTGGDQG